MQTKNGFTLVELLVTVAILGVLAAVAVPAFLNQSKRAKTSEVSLNLRNMYYSARSYYETERYLRSGVVHGSKCLVDEIGLANLQPEIPGALKQTFDASSHASWVAMAFTIGEPVYYGYTFLTFKGPLGGNNCLPPGGSIAPGLVYQMQAYGDLDGDGDMSTFELAVAIDDELELARGKTLYIENELE